MNRRELLAASLAATCGVALPMSARAADAPAAQPAGGAAEFYELRLYHLRRGPMPARMDAYLRDALIPAARRAGCGPIGAFNLLIGPDGPTTYVLIPHATAQSIYELPDRLAADAEYQRAAEPFLAAAASDPSFVGVESTFARAAGGMPRLVVPAATVEKSPRIFELRTYRSHGARASVKKIEMFDAGGELAIFRRLGLTPVYFAQNLIGRDLPSLTYLLTFPDLATRERNWAAFRADPEWKKLSATPGYTDAEIVSSINSVLLSPTDYSQV